MIFVTGGLLYMLARAILALSNPRRVNPVDYVGVILGGAGWAMMVYSLASFAIKVLP